MQLATHCALLVDRILDLIERDVHANLAEAVGDPALHPWLRSVAGEPTVDGGSVDGTPLVVQLVGGGGDDAGELGLVVSELGECARGEDGPRTDLLRRRTATRRERVLARCRVRRPVVPDSDREGIRKAPIGQAGDSLSRSWRAHGASPVESEVSETASS